MIWATPVFFSAPWVPEGQATVSPLPSFHCGDAAVRYLVKLLVVPEPSERCATVIDVSGRLTPGLSLAIAGSFHFMILAWKMLASVSGLSCNLSTPDRLVGDGDRPAHRRHVHERAGRHAVGVLDRAVGTGEVGQSLAELLLAGAGADRVVGHRDVRCLTRVRGDDLLVVGIREAGARSLQLPRAVGCVATGIPTIAAVVATATSQHGKRDTNEDEPREHLAVHLRLPPLLSVHRLLT